MAPKKKRKKEQPHLLSPTVFLSSISEFLHINTIIPADPPPSPPKSRNPPSTTATITTDTNTDTDTATASSSSSGGSKHRAAVSFTNEAIEALRRCHGEFIALVSSELVSRKDDEYDEDCRHRETTTNEPPPKKVATMTPKEATITLTNLEFDDYLSIINNTSKSKLDKTNNSCTSSSTSKDCKSGGAIHNCTIATKMGRPGVRRGPNKGKSQRKKFKSVFKNSQVTADLLKEQERLFALSAAKAVAKMDGTNIE